MAETGHNTKVYVEHGGDKLTLESGATLNSESGSTVTLAGTNTLSGTTTISGATTLSGAQTLTAALTVGSGGSIVNRLQTKAANYSVVAADSGSIFEATAADVVFSLPATAAGLTYTFITGAVSGGTGMAVSPVSADKIMGSLMGATGPVAITSADNKDVINTGATDVLGDSVTLVGDGANGWYVIGCTGVWAREA